MARAKKKEVEQEQQQVIEQPVVEKPKRIIPNQDTDLRKFPTLQQAHIIGKIKAGTMYEIKNTIGGPYGWFYELSNGGFVVKNGNYKFV